ncbi:MAG TPA: ABC transporter permease [Acidobacteriaceae bacterium]
MRNLTLEIRYALRQLRKHPGFTLVATLTLALGIAAATAVFSLVDTVLLRPLPFPQPERIVALDTLAREHGTVGAATLPSGTSYPNFFDWRTRARSFDSLASWQEGSFTLGSSGGNAPARRVEGMTVSSDFFRVLGVDPALGRSFTRAEESAGNRSVILSHRLWQSAFNQSPDAIGKSIRLNDETYFVVGVMPPSFAFADSEAWVSDVWVTPSTAQEGKSPSGQQRGWNQINVLGRLRRGVTMEQARAEMQTIQQALAAQYTDDTKLTGVSVVFEMEDLTGGVEQPLHLLFGAVCLLLLIACANVAGLLLTRSAARRPELALRTALGASRFEITRQLLIESLTLSACGGALGFAMAAAALRIAPSLLPTGLPRIHELSLDPRVFLFAVAASLLTGLLFGVVPAWRSARLDPAVALRDGTRASTAGRSQQRLHSLLVIAETALGLVLLVGAGLLMLSFHRVLSVDPGFNPRHLLTFKIGMPEKRYGDQRRLQFSQQLQARFAALPGVTDAAFGYPMPMSQNGMSLSFSIDGRPSATGNQPSARSSVVSANFFHAMQMPLRRGRLFSAAEDQPHSPPVMIINQAFADRFFPGEDALGKHITSDLSSGDQPESREVIGIVQNVTHDSLTETAAPAYYIPFAQVPIIPPTFALRVAGEPAAYVETVRSLVAQQDASLPVYRVHTNLLTQSTAQQRFETLLLSGFALLALMLAAIGLYGVLSYMVAQRTSELSLRMALGAQRSQVLALILRRGLALTTAGIAIGVAASALLTRYLSSLLFKTRPLDEGTLLSVTLLLFVVSLSACLVPAWRAARLSPNEGLRQQ